MALSSRTYRAVLSYYLQSPGRPVDDRTISAIIGESTQSVEQTCDALVQAGLLLKLSADDVSRPVYQLIEQEVARARTAATAGTLLHQ